MEMALFRNPWRWQATLANDRALQYKPGNIIHGFTVKEVTPVPDLFLTAIRLEHDKTGAKYLHLAREDSNNLFNVQFLTTPLDSTGVPHILEHTVLCGSEKYPCRDPFFKMLNRSLSTFMNAFTASDYTMYPFSTQNAKDFKNLMSVYLDAVFFPKLRELDFWQEGWRLEYQNPTDRNSPMIFKGVVFNEMKGVFSDNERIFIQNLQNKLLPDNTYAVVSGGEPLDIPDLTWNQLKKFHATHYHPSNARFFTYGDFPLEQHLKQIHEDALSKFDRIDPHTNVPKQQRWSSPKEYEITCGVDTMASDQAKQTMFSMSYLLSDITDSFETFTLSNLSSLLVDGPNSPFYKALIEANIGTDFTPDTGYNDSTRDTFFSIGLQGIRKEDVKTVKEIINKTFHEVIEKGFDPERIEAILHSLEIQMKNQPTNFGFIISSNLASFWNHGGNPVDLLKVSEQIEKFRQLLKEKPRFLQDKVKQYFQDNPHVMSLTMSPDEKYYEKKAEQENEKLKEKVKALTEEQKKEVYEKGLELLDLQSKPQDASCLPALKVSDIERTIQRTELEIAYAGDVPVQYCPQPTNGVVYFRAVSSLNTLPEELKPYVPLFCNVLTEMGSGVYDYRELAQQIELTTGGLTVRPHVVTDDTDMDTYEQGVLFSSFCLDRNLPDMMHLWSEIFNSPHFEDDERLQVLVRQRAQELANGIATSGQSYASTRASRTLTAAGELKELFDGMEQVQLMKRIAEMTNLSPILRKMSRIRKYLLLSDSMRCAVNATPQEMSKAAKEVEHFLLSIHRNKKERKAIRPHIVEKSINPAREGVKGSHKVATRKLVHDPTFKPCQMKTHFSMPFQVNYIGECIRTVPYMHEDFASLRLLAKIMSTKFLHSEIREKGGAYGGGANMGVDGVFLFYSYRDPNSLSTLKSFEKSVDWAKSGNFNLQDLEEGKLSIFSTVDAPVAPANKGTAQFLNGVTDDIRQKHREQLFAATHCDLVNVANKYLTLGKRTHGTAILGPENANIAKDPSWIMR
ncbi:presequence protease, mitochondrial isoform X2 [Engystomops pustulosus]|uniref:presequence protease, mitochondrial isoform X2 n=1 Tax=Engystomops pustulosus TaxID=76066 RepID=UPI003AFB6F06